MKVDSNLRNELQFCMVTGDFYLARRLIVSHKNDCSYLDHPDLYGFTPMHYAAELQSLELMRLLRACGSKTVHARSFVKRTPRSLYLNKKEFDEFVQEHTIGNFLDTDEESTDLLCNF